MNPKPVVDALGEAQDAMVRACDEARADQTRRIVEALEARAEAMPETSVIALYISQTATYVDSEFGGGK